LAQTISQLVSQSVGWPGQVAQLAMVVNWSSVSESHCFTVSLSLLSLQRDIILSFMNN